MIATAKLQEQTGGLRSWQHGAAFLCAFAVIAARRPDAILRPQFWAEDGRVFYGDAYNLGPWIALFRPYGGYFHAVPRLAACLVLLVPLSHAPLVLNLVAIAVQALPATLLLASRSSVWGSLRYRALLAGIYLALPNCWELGAIITNSQCLLALSAFLLLVASIPGSMRGWLINISFLLLAGLSGPYCIFLLPFAMFLAWKHSERGRWLYVGVLAACSLVQTWGLLILSPGIRLHYYLGASLESFAHVLAGQVYLGTLIGSNSLAFHPGPRLSVFIYFVAIGGTAIVAASIANSILEMRLFVLFSCMILVASLISPAIHARPGVPLWELMASAGGIHYWFFPTLTFAWCVVFCFASRVLLLRIIAGYLLFFFCIGIVRDFRQPAFKDMQFNDYAARFEAAPPGTAVTIPLNPDGWSMTLVKHAE